MVLRHMIGSKQRSTRLPRGSGIQVAAYIDAPRCDTIEVTSTSASGAVGTPAEAGSLPFRNQYRPSHCFTTGSVWFDRSDMGCHCKITGPERSRRGTVRLSSARIGFVIDQLWFTSSQHIFSGQTGLSAFPDVRQCTP